MELFVALPVDAPVVLLELVALELLLDPDVPWAGAGAVGVAPSSRIASRSLAMSRFSKFQSCRSCPAGGFVAGAYKV